MNIHKLMILKLSNFYISDTILDLIGSSNIILNHWKNFIAQNLTFIGSYL